jgi:predicted alpha/beta hydrolase family esterase
VTIRVLNIPGLWNSGATHWQTNWERERGDTRRVLQDEWERPRREDWIRRIRDELRALPAPVVLAAHSLGCCTVAHLARDAAPGELARVRGARYVDAGPLGHLNSDSNLGMWPRGQALPEELLHEQTFPGSRGVD